MGAARTTLLAILPVGAVLLAILLVGMAILGQTSAAVAYPPEGLINELMCPSPAGPRSLATADTPDAIWMRDFIRAKTREGWSRQRILDTLIRQYGEQILAVPPKEGFSLAAWLTPFVTIFGGVAVTGFLLTRWLRERKRHDAYLLVEITRDVDERDLHRYEAQLQKELEQFE